LKYKEKNMNNKMIRIVVAVIVAGAAFLPMTRADEYNQQTKLTFNQPVEIPGRVLPAGTYWFVLMDDTSNRGVVRVFSSDWKTLYATESTVNAERQEPAEGTVLKFAERGSAGIQALLTWFYPGETIGHEFLYSRQVENELAQDKQQTVLVQPRSGSDSNPGI
jgi:hypothetical protein